MARSRLRLVADLPAPHEAAPERQVQFCSHCAARPTAIGSTRVCGDCGFGVLLECGESAAPGFGDAFLVVDRAQSICALSLGAERLLEVSEIHAVHRHLGELLTPADTEVPNGGTLAFAISAAVGGAAEGRRFTLRPANLFGVRLRARIVACGPTPGALICLD